MIFIVYNYRVYSYSSIINLLVFPTRIPDYVHQTFSIIRQLLGILMSMLSMSDHHICSCAGSPLICHTVGHIVSIVGRNVLEDLLTKGPKYR